MMHEGLAQSIQRVLDAFEDEAVGRHADFQDQVLTFAGELVQGGIHRDALEILSRLSRVLPDKAEVWGRMGVLLTALRCLEDGEACFHKALSIDPYYPEAYLNLAELYKAQQRDLEANDCLRTFLSMHQRRQADGESRVHTNLGWLNSVKGNTEEALRHFQEAFEKGVENPRTFLDLRLASRHLKESNVPDSSEFTSMLERLEESIREESGRV